MDKWQEGENKAKSSVSLVKLNQYKERRQQFELNHVNVVLCSLETYKVAEITVILLQPGQETQSYQIIQGRQRKLELVLAQENEGLLNPKVDKEAAPTHHRT